MAVVLAFLLAIPSAAWADDGAAAAAEYYNQATAAYQQGDYQKAADLLDLAFGSDPDLVYKYNRILALQALGDFKTALAELNTMYGPMKADGQARFEDIDQVKAQLEAAIKSKQQGEDPNGDGSQNGDSGNDGAPIEPAEPKKSGVNVPAIILISVGGASIVAGILFSTAVFLPNDIKRCLGIGVSSDCDDLVVENASDPEDNTTRAEAFEWAQDVKRQHEIATVVLLGAGVVAAGVGVVLLVLDGGDESTPPASAGFDSLQLLPTVSADGMGAALQLRF